uniref:Xaa-Pro dipeptidyl-peptidase C-terminal domain-containing protein n=1 Tax=Phenylobacterium glaciei TaxID=2803784 RepID=A0A974P4H9_9CAUL|nr:hypothetical protein JKL49_07850 [Phenylobacterium glaciei]
MASRWPRIWRSWAIHGPPPHRRRPPRRQGRGAGDGGDAGGKSWLVSYGLKNLTHRDSDETPQALEPGRSYDVSFPLFLVGHRFTRATAFASRSARTSGPWPGPRRRSSPSALRSTTAGSACRCGPLRPHLRRSRFRSSMRRRPPARRRRRWSPRRRCPRPLPDRARQPAGSLHLARHRDHHLAGTLGDGGVDRGSAQFGRWRQEASSSWKRDAWDCSLSAVIELTSTPTEFVLSEQLTARQGATVVFQRRKDSRIARNLV